MKLDRLSPQFGKLNIPSLEIQSNQINKGVNTALLGGLEVIKQMCFQVEHCVVRRRRFILEPALRGLLPLRLRSSHTTLQLVFSLWRLCSNLFSFYLTTVRGVRIGLYQPAMGTNEHARWAVHLPEWKFYVAKDAATCPRRRFRGNIPYRSTARWIQQRRRDESRVGFSPLSQPSPAVLFWAHVTAKGGGWRRKLRWDHLHHSSLTFTLQATPNTCAECSGHIRQLSQPTGNIWWTIAAVLLSFCLTLDVGMRFTKPPASL